MKRHWKTGIVTAIVVAVALSAVAVAYGAARGSSVRRGAGRAACVAVMSNAEALRAMQVLRTEHRKDMRNWYERYGSNPSSAEARAALETLRQEHRREMRNLFSKYGVTLRSGVGPRGGMGGMMMPRGGRGGAGLGGCPVVGAGTGSEGATWQGGVPSGRMTGGPAY